MAAKQIFNFGGAKFAYDGTSVIFSGAIGTIEYVPVYKYVRQNINYKEKYSPAGWRVNIEIKQLYNIEDDSWEDHLILNSYLSEIMLGANRTITIYPRYNEDEDDEQSLQYECRLVSPYIPRDIENHKYGQVINLEFTVPELADTIPSVLSDIQADTYTDDSGNTYVDDSSNTYTDGGV